MINYPKQTSIPPTLPPSTIERERLYRPLGTGSVNIAYLTPALRPTLYAPLQDNKQPLGGSSLEQIIHLFIYT